MLMHEEGCDDHRRAEEGCRGCASTARTATPPEEWLLGVICEEFGCLPSQALAEPIQPALEILRLRNYARAFTEFEGATTERPPSDSARDLVGGVLAYLLEKRDADGG